MSDDTHIDGHNEETEFEREDLARQTDPAFPVGLIVGCLLVALVLRGMYSYLDAYENRHQPAQSPLVQQTTADTRTCCAGRHHEISSATPGKQRAAEINDFRDAGRKDIEQLWLGGSAGRRGANSD